MSDLCALVHPCNGHSKVFAMIKAYLDESGVHQGAAICVIAGYFGRRRQWEEFEKDWRKGLEDYKVPMKEFHAKDLVPKQSGFFWKWPKGRCEAFVERMAKTIAKHRLYPVSSGIIVKDFNSFSLKQRRFLTGATLNKHGRLVTTGSPNKPYFVPFMYCLRRVIYYTPLSGKAHFFFGLDTPFSGYARSLFQEFKTVPIPLPDKFQERLGDIAFPMAKETPQLQAADLLVHLTYQHMLERQKVGDWHVMASGVLAISIRNRRAAHDFTFLDKICLQEGLKQTYATSGNWNAHV